MSSENDIRTGIVRDWFIARDGWSPRASSRTGDKEDGRFSNSVGRRFDRYGQEPLRCRSRRRQKAMMAAGVKPDDQGWCASLMMGQFDL